jgi:Fe-S cluster assembly protein SufD
MKPELTARAWFEQFVEQRQSQVDDSDTDNGWVNRLREKARQEISRLPIPTRKSESWRYTLLEGLFSHHFNPVYEEFQALQPDDVDEWIFRDTDAFRIVFANGRYMPAMTSFDELPDGVSIGSLRRALQHKPEVLSAWFGQTAGHTQDVFTALNTALMSDGLFIHLGRDTILERPLEVVHLNLSVDEPVLIQPSNLIVLEQGASAQIVERYISTGSSTYFYNAVSEILLEENATLNHVQLQEESEHAYHLHRRFLSQGQGSRYHNGTLSLGGKWARNELQVRFQGQNAECLTSGLYLAGDRQLLDQHLDVQHRLPSNSSQHRYKGVIYGAGRAVFDGRVLVSQDAQKTDAHLSNHNLLLSQHGEVDTKPQLEIYADDVKCSHGTTVGQLEPEQLFYLRSRGIPQQQAIKLLCSGFAAEIIETIDIPAVREYACHRLDDILHNAIGKTDGTGHG